MTDFNLYKIQKTKHGLVSTRNAQAGFTLIELSIVLVIIGLIVGGILTGQSLIKQAQMRATLTTINKLNTAVNTFRDKFGGIPGDLASYANVGLATPATAGGGAQTSFAVGDGLVEDATLTAAKVYTGESGVFFYHLFQAQIIQDFYSTPLTAQSVLLGGAAASTPALIAGNMLTAPFAPSFFIWVASGIGATTTSYNASLAPNILTYNYIRLGKVTAITTGGAITDGNGMNPVDAAAFDSKLDDGQPANGNVIVTTSGSGDLGIGTLGATHCALSATAYDVAANPAAPECSLAIQAGF